MDARHKHHDPHGRAPKPSLKLKKLKTIALSALFVFHIFTTCLYILTLASCCIALIPRLHLPKGVEQDIDPMLDPVMEKQFIIKGKKMSVNVSDKVMDFDPKFMMYFITRLPNPSFSPELQAKVGTTVGRVTAWVICKASDFGEASVST